jgi:hypothetical protein
LVPELGMRAGTSGERIEKGLEPVKVPALFADLIQ